MKKLGIIGGMGPLAGAYFYQRVIENTGASRDAGHIPVYLIGDPRIPDRTAHLLGQGDDPLPALRLAALMLEEMGAEIIAVPCNTAHAYLGGLFEAVSVPLLDMPCLTVEKAVSEGASRLGILSTRGTLSARVYHRAAEEFGAEVLTLPPPVSELLEKKIYAQKGGACMTGDVYIPYAEHLIREGAEVVILGCTEISAAFSGACPPYCLDALEILARKSVEYCGALGKGGMNRDVWRAFTG